MTTLVTPDVIASLLRETIEPPSDLDALPVAGHDGIARWFVIANVAGFVYGAENVQLFIGRIARGRRFSRATTLRA